MINTEVTGEQSCDGRENGGGPTGSERPLKKARFAWQVKGKYRSKTEDNESNKNPTQLSEVSSELSTNPRSISVGSQVDDSLLKQDYGLLDSVIVPNNSMLSTSTPTVKNQLRCPKYIGSSISQVYQESGNNLTPTFYSRRPQYTEDECIANWQSLQLLKCCIENNLNVFRETSTDDTIDEEDARHIQRRIEMITQLPDPNDVENEGILMAISAHGLQNASNYNDNARNIDDANTSRSHSYLPTSLHCLSPPNDDNHEHDKIENKSKDCLQPWQESSESPNSSDVSPIAYFSYPENSNIDTEWQAEVDFMNTAILNAIKNKGLTVSETEYG